MIKCAQSTIRHKSIITAYLIRLHLHFLLCCSNIIELFECVSEVLDTPSKKTLWMFIIARLPSHHQQYCINQINLPTDVLLGTMFCRVLCENERSLFTFHKEPHNLNDLLWFKTFVSTNLEAWNICLRPRTKKTLVPRLLSDSPWFCYGLVMH